MVVNVLGFLNIITVYESERIFCDFRSEIADNRTCDRDVTCWPELWAPLNQVFYFTMPLSVARREVEYNLVWSLFVIFAAIGKLFS